MKIINVTYLETSTATQSNHRYFEVDHARDATNFAKKVSRLSGRTSIIWNSTGDYFNGEFYEFESTLKAVYVDGVKQKI